jgi:hypothetical protein
VDALLERDAELSVLEGVVGAAGGVSGAFSRRG